METHENYQIKILIYTLNFNIIVRQGVRVLTLHNLHTVYEINDFFVE